MALRDADIRFGERALAEIPITNQLKCKINEKASKHPDSQPFIFVEQD
jgi:hypothetical protein